MSQLLGLADRKRSRTKEFPIRFRLFTLLSLIGLIAIALIAIKHPNRIVWLWVSLCSSIVFLTATATALGSGGKLRLQCISCCVLATIFYIGGNFQQSPFWEAESLSRAAIERFTNILAPHVAPDGSMVFQDDQGNFTIRRSAASSWEQVTKEEIEKSKLTNYVVTESNAVSESAFISIYRHLIALFVGWCGYAMTGLAYEHRRRIPSQSP